VSGVELNAEERNEKIANIKANLHKLSPEDQELFAEIMETYESLGVVDE